MSARGRVLMARSSSESGIALVMALVVLVILSLISAALVNLVVSEYSTAATLDRATQALFASEAGAERAIAYLKPIADWNTVSASPSSWTTLYSNTDLPDSGSAVCSTLPCPVGTFTVALRRSSVLDPRTNIMVRAVGKVRGASRAVEFVLHRLTEADLTLYSIEPVDICSISGGGSLQFHGSAYFESDLCLKGGSQAGFYDDRQVFTSDSDPDYQNHLFVRGDLDVTTGNPEIGTVAQPYWWVHVEGDIVGSSNKFNPEHLDKIVPSPFYPSVLDKVKLAFDQRGNVLEPVGGTMRLVVCRWNGSAWVKDTSSSNLRLVTAQVFYLPAAATWTGTCATGDVNAVRSGGDYMLFWDGSVSPPPPGTGNLVFKTPSLPIYVPGAVHVGQDVRFEDLGSIVVGNHPAATTSDALVVQSGCALDLNGTGSCDGGTSAGRWVRARVSPCENPPGPGADDPQSTFARVNPSNLGPDVAVFVVNGSAYGNLNANACDQEMNLVAIVGDRGSTAAFTLGYKLQWYGILMTRQMNMSQVPDFWQMPDLLSTLPPWFGQNFLTSVGRSVQIRNWRELF